MSVTEDVFELIGSARPRDWTDQRETYVRAMFDRLCAAILADDEPSAVAAMTELHEKECQIAHRLYEVAFGYLEEPVAVILIELPPRRPAAGNDDRGTG